MIPEAPSEHVRARFAAQRTTGTSPELHLRRELFRLGFRYRVNYPIPGMSRRSVDIAFTRAKVAVFVDGCFWHRCPVHAVPAIHNSDWWQEKLEGNASRDRETTGHLEGLGWTVVRVWEHEDVTAAAERVLAALNRPSSQGP